MQLCSDYATKRKVFGKFLTKHPLHMKILSRMEVKKNIIIWPIILILKLLDRFVHSLSVFSPGKLITQVVKMEKASDSDDILFGWENPVSNK